MMLFHSFPFPHKLKLWLLVEEGGGEFIIHEDETMPTITHQSSSHGQATYHAFMVNFRQEIANSTQEDRQNYHGNM
jgi:hypothetical protein